MTLVRISLPVAVLCLSAMAACAPAQEPWEIPSAPQVSEVARLSVGVPAYHAQATQQVAYHWSEDGGHAGTAVLSFHAANGAEYERCQCTGFFARAEHALRLAFNWQPDTGAGGFYRTGSYYSLYENGLPGQTVSWRTGRMLNARRVSVALTMHTMRQLYREFSPELRRVARRRH